MMMRAPEKERKKEASESFFFPRLGGKRRGQFWCQEFFFPLKFFLVKRRSQNEENFLGEGVYFFNEC